MKKNASTGFLSFLLVVAAIVCVPIFAVHAVFAQTSSFTYQGSLNVSGTPATGSFDMQFKLFDALAGGSQQGATSTLNGVTVTGGTFSVVLDFQNSGFPGANRFLEIAVQPAGGGSFTTLAP